jgi:hypothetical protein
VASLDQTRRPRRRTRASSVGFALAGVLSAAGLLAGCSGAGGPHVASLGQAETSTTIPGVGGGAVTSQNQYAQALSYSKCMRIHGVGNFPDPTANGSFLYAAGKLNGVNIDMSSHEYLAANRACHHFMPQSPFTPAEQQRTLQELLRFVQCLRHHGVPNMQDPIVNAHSIVLPVPDSPNSPQWKAATQACRALQPFGS